MLEERACDSCGNRFQPYRQGHRACSKRCRYDLNKDRWNEERRSSPTRKQTQLRHNLKRNYGITPEDYERMLAEQHGLCAICSNPPNPDGVKAASRLHVDHDHVTGKVRALLCLSCNHGLGKFKDDPALLREAAEYVERYR